MAGPHTADAARRSAPSPAIPTNPPTCSHTPLPERHTRTLSLSVSVSLSLSLCVSLPLRVTDLADSDAPVLQLVDFVRLRGVVVPHGAGCTVAEWDPLATAVREALRPLGIPLTVGSKTWALADQFANLDILLAGAWSLLQHFIFKCLGGAGCRCISIWRWPNANAEWRETQRDTERDTERQRERQTERDRDDG